MDSSDHSFTTTYITHELYTPPKVYQKSLIFIPDLLFPLIIIPTARVIYKPGRREEEGREAPNIRRYLNV